MNRRDLIRMNDDEIRAFLEEQRTLQVATIDHNGWPHLVAMWYALINDEVVFWTYARSQKAVNLRGVQIRGNAALSDERAIVQRVGEAIWERYTGPLNENTRPMVEAQAAKRVVIFVKPVEIVSWDHRKLGGGY